MGDLWSQTWKGRGREVGSFVPMRPTGETAKRALFFFFFIFPSS